MASKRIKYNTWPELLEAIKEYSSKGYKTDINGFEDLSQNILTVYGEINEYNKRNNAC